MFLEIWQNSQIHTNVPCFLRMINPMVWNIPSRAVVNFLLRDFLCIATWNHVVHEVNPCCMHHSSFVSFEDNLNNVLHISCCSVVLVFPVWTIMAFCSAHHLFVWCFLSSLTGTWDHLETQDPLLQLFLRSLTQWPLGCLRGWLLWLWFYSHSVLQLSDWRTG